MIESHITDNITLAFNIGLKVPEVQIFPTREDMKEFLSEQKKPWIIFPNSNLVMEKLEGVEFSIQADVFDGQISNGNAAIEDIHLLTGGMGPKVDSSLITVFDLDIDNHPIGKKIYELREHVEEYVVDNYGSITIHLTSTDQGTFYKQIDFYPNAVRNKCKELLREDEEAIYSCGILLYKMQGLQIVPDDTMTHFATGKRIKDTWKTLYETISEYNGPDWCYRTDGSDIARRGFNLLKRRKAL